MHDDYYECRACHAVSYNTNDIIERYCGRCHEFEDQVPRRIVGRSRPSNAEVASTIASIQESIDRG